MNPMPSDGATDVLLALAHSWTASDPDGEILSFDVYFGIYFNPTL